MTAKRLRTLSPRPPRLKPAQPVTISPSARSWAHMVLIGLGAVALFFVMLLAVGYFGNASMHGGVLPSTTQGKFYRPD